MTRFLYTCLALATAALSYPCQSLAAQGEIAVPANADVASGQPAYRLIASYDRPGLPVPHWEFRIGTDGSAQYTSKHASTAQGVEDSDVRFHLSDAGRDKLWTLLNHANGLVPCETRTKNLAQMGMKTIQYRSDVSASPASCTFNFTDNKPLASAAEYLGFASYTLEIGATLDRLHRYDRLGLDATMLQLATAVKEGRAVELGSIRPTLQSLATDDAVMERVRAKAGQLIALSEQQSAAR